MLDRIAAGRTDLVIDWVRGGGAVDTRLPDGASLAQCCAYYGDVSALKLLLSEGETLAALGADLGLNAAAFHGHWRLCQFLLEAGADSNRPHAETGEVPLHAALSAPASLAHERVVQVLLAAGAEPDRATRPGVATGALMRDAHTRGETPLHRAAAFATIGAIRMLMAAGARVDARDTNGDTPLAWASWAQRPVEVLRLLCYGEHRIHPDHVGMAVNLLGRPLD